MPINVPIPDDLSIVYFSFFNSNKVGNLRAFACILSTTAFNFSDCLKSSLTANRPIRTGTKCIPSSRSGISNVNLSTPVVKMNSYSAN